MSPQSFFFYPPSSPEPRKSPTLQSAGWPEIFASSDSDRIVTSSATMARDGSKDSAYYSLPAGSPANVYHHINSPTPSSYSAGSPGFYSPYNLSAQHNQQNVYQDAAPTLSRTSSARSYSTRVTPKSFGLTEADLTKFYKFVVPKGREPHWDLDDVVGWDLHDMPHKVFLDLSEHRKNDFPCMFPGCDWAKTFKRPADLERHYRNVHGSPDQKDKYFCDYTPCKKRGAFTRKDHFRDHLRDYHKEDIGSMKKSDGKESQKVDEEERQAQWVGERKIESKWWRCPKCLDRIQIADSGFVCQTCKLPLEPQRIERIERFRAAKLKTSYAAPAASSHTTMDAQYGYSTPAPTSYTASGTCADCHGSGCMVVGGSWEPCSSCELSLEQYYSEDPRWNQ